MNLVFDRNSLLKEIAIAQEIISTKNAISILSNVLLNADNNMLLIKATDIKVNFETKIPVQVNEPGSTTIYCDKFLSILNSLPEGDIEFIQEDTNITIKPISKKIKFNLKCITSDKYPEFGTDESAQFFDVPAKDFKEMIVQTVFAVSADETRYFMNGVYLEKKENNLVMVATDGRRLAYIQKKQNNILPDFKGVIIPPKVLNLIQKKLSDEGMISIAITDKTIYFRFGSYDISSVLIEGQFPNYSRVIPENNEKSMELDVSDFSAALKRVSLLVEKKSLRIFVKINAGVLTITSEDTDMGTANEEIPCQYDDEEVILALNCRYLEEPLKAIGSDRIKIEFSPTMKAIKLMPVPESDFFHIIMPMQME